jgi:hypothetical protein
MKVTQLFWSAPRTAAVCGVLFLMQLPFAHGRSFSNSFVTFELPDSWKCNLEDSDWVCNEQTTARLNSIMILAAKRIGPGDTMDKYYDYLARPKTLKDTEGNPQRESTVLWVRRTTIAGTQWVESLQLNSEVADYYTHYLATIEGHIAVLVTLSAHKSIYAQTQDRFQATIRSLHVLDPLAAPEHWRAAKLAPDHLGPLQK